MFLTSSLNRGGAERQLALLAREIDHTRFAVSLVTFNEGGALRAEIDEIKGVTVLSLRRRGLRGLPISLWRFAWHMRQLKPQIVHGYLNQANVLALLFGKLAGAKVVWGLRASYVDFSLYDRRAVVYFRLAARLSRFADLIVVNSQAGREAHVAQGFAESKMIVIPNGFDTRRFSPDTEARERIRRGWGISERERVIGLVARLDPIKDHPTFLRAAALLASAERDVRFVCVGDGPKDYRRSLQCLAENLGVSERFIWAGEQADMPAVQNALDIATSSSTSEGFSNAIGEAMACGVPCVVTDVGDSALLVGETGRIVPAGDPEALASAWRALLDLPLERRRALGAAARERMVSVYSLANLTHRTEDALTRLVAYGA